MTAVTGGRGALSERDEPPAARVIARRRPLPGGRAALGALLMTAAAVGVFLAYADAGEGLSDELVVAARTIRLGEVIEERDLEVVLGEVPDEIRHSTFAEMADVVGHVALSAIGPGELVQASAITADRSVAAVHEIALTLPREQIAVGRLRQGERVDVFVTYDDRTTSVVRGAEVVQITAESDGSLTGDREIDVVVAVPSGEVVAALVHALRTGEVTVVRSTFADRSSEPALVFEPDGGDAPPPREGAGAAGR